MKKPAAHAVHNKAPPIEYLPASQSVQALSAIRVPTIEMYEPAAQYVCVVQDDAAAAEYFPLVQSPQDVAPPAEALPAAQFVHVLSAAAVQVTAIYFPAAQYVHDWHAACPVDAVKKLVAHPVHEAAPPRA